MVSVATNGRRLSSRYTLLEKIGAGGQGEVWRARDDARGVDVALKVLSGQQARSEAAWAALEHEYKVVARLDHPSILKIYPPYRDKDLAVLPMELVTGGDMRRLRGASYLEVVPALIEVAQALEHAHERGVVHRDLKPSNVLFDASGRVKLADFGAAARTALAAAASRDALTSGISPFSASPQQLRGDPPSVMDDVYGLGALAYELLSGYPPYYPRFDLQRVMEEPVPELRPVHQAPRRLIALIMAMLEKQPERRPSNMRDIIDDLDATLNDTLQYSFDDVADLPQGVGRTAAPPPPPSRPVSQPAPAPQAAYSNPVPPPVVTPPPARVQPAPARSAPQVVRQPAAASRQPSLDTTFALDDAPDAISVGPRERPQPQVVGNTTPWADIKIETVPSMLRIEPQKARRWPWAVLALLIAGAAAVFYVPRYAPHLLPENVAAALPKASDPSADAASTPEPNAAAASAAASTPTVTPSAPQLEDTESIAKAQEARADFDRRIAALEERGAGVWGGREFADAKARAAEAVGAYDAGNPRLSAERLAEALRLVGVVEGKAPQALAAQLARGEKALEDGDAATARQAFEFARRIDPRSQRAAQGLRRADSLNQVLPLLADAANAESAKDFARAAQLYSKALSVDSENQKAKAGLERANAAFGADSYAKAIGAGFAALGAGKLEDAQAAFEKARSIQPNGREAANGLERVGAALRARGFESVRARAAALEAEERWNEALKEYEAALKLDPSLAFAQAGRARAQERATLALRLQALIDEPNRLASPGVREEALQLLEKARGTSPSGPVLRSQIARLELLLPSFDKPVRLALVSDNATQVVIQRVGSFGAFSRREIDIKPGKYTVIGTRAGYRDVRREITISPGDEVQTISVRCVEPI